MTLIPLQEWARIRGISLRTAQRLAKSQKLTAFTRVYEKAIVKKIKGYMVHKDAEITP